LRGKGGGLQVESPLAERLLSWNVLTMEAAAALEVGQTVSLERAKVRGENLQYAQTHHKG